MSTEDENETQIKLAKIDSRKAAFEKSPVWFTIWSWGSDIIEAIAYVAMLFIIAQCTCSGCVVRFHP